MPNTIIPGDPYPSRAGLVAAFAGETPPQGWLLCDGSSYLRTDYADLFAAIGTVYGNEDADHFNVPDMRGKIAVGLNLLETEFNTLGGVGGEKTHIITSTEMPSHTHIQNAHSHLTRRYPTATGASSGFTIDTSMSGTLADNTLPTKTETAVNQNTGGDGAHNNLQPYIVLNYVIRT